MSFPAHARSRAVVAAGILAACCAAHAPAAGKRLDYVKYLDLDEKAKQGLIQRYVRKDKRGFWIVSVAKYQVYTTVSGEFALRMAVLMDDFHAKFAAIFNGSFRLRERPKLYVLPDMPAYQAFLRSQGAGAGFSAGMYLPTRKILVGQRGQGDRQLQRILFHEGTHQLLHFYTGQYDVPVWFHEGAATNFETWSLRLTPVENVKANVELSGRYRGYCVKAALDGQLMGTKRLFGISHRQWIATADPQSHYATAWSLVNYLLSTKNGQRNFNVMLAAFRRNRKLSKVMSETVRKKLETAWHDDVKSRLAAYERHFLPGLMLARRGKGQEGLERVEQGIAKTPKLLDGRYYKGRVLFRMGRFEEAAKVFEDLLKKKAGFPHMNSLLGACYVRMEDYVKARTFLKKAVFRHPNDKELKELLDSVKGK